MKKMMRCLMVSVIAVSAMFLTGCGETEVEPMSFYKVTYTGVDGDAALNVEFSDDEFEKALITSAPERKQEDLKEYLNTVDFSDYISWEADRTEGLSNGDTVNFTITYDDAFLEGYKLKFGGETTETIKVAGLQEVTVIDAFDPAVFNVDMDTKGVHITVTGVSPELSVSLQSNIDRDDPRSMVWYSIENTYGYENGDSVTVSARLGKTQDENGKPYVLKEESVSIPLEGYDSYLTDAEQISEETLAAIGEECRLHMDAQFSKSGIINMIYAPIEEFSLIPEELTYSNVSSITVRWDKAYLMTLRAGVTRDYQESNNVLIIPVHIDAAGIGGVYDCDNMIYGLMFRNIVVDGDGKISVTPESIQPDNGIVYADETTFMDSRINAFSDRFTITEIDISSWNEAAE